MDNSTLKKKTDRDEKITVCIKLSKDLLEKIDSIKEVSRSEFIRSAILEKLNSTSNSQLSNLVQLHKKIKTLEERLSALELEIKKQQPLKPISENELFGFCRDDKDRKIISLLLEKGYVKTTELEPILELKRRQITNRIKRLAALSNRIIFIAGYRNGIKKAWWLVKE